MSSLVLAYLTGALAGGAAGAGGILILAALDSEHLGAEGIFIVVMPAATFVLTFFSCLFVELAIATPLLLGYHSFRWRYLNRLTAALLGLGIGVAPALLFLSRPFGDGTSELLGYFADGRLTTSGWWRLIRGAALSGAIGLASATVFALTAVRKPGGSPD